VDVICNLKTNVGCIVPKETCQRVVKNTEVPFKKLTCTNVSIQKVKDVHDHISQTICITDACEIPNICTPPPVCGCNWWQKEEMIWECLGKIYLSFYNWFRNLY